MESYSDKKVWERVVLMVKLVISAFRHGVLFGPDVQISTSTVPVVSSVPFGMESYSDHGNTSN